MSREPTQTGPGEHCIDPDDPFGPIRLPPSQRKSDFWKRYDRLADIHDKKLINNLNGNLDVLLIFAALFSAINTTFITITMPNLSPSASDVTNDLLRILILKDNNQTLIPSELHPPFSPDSNAVAVNCLLYASLCCSLIAAVGALLAKEWLQSYDRTGQTGPLEDQARLRQQKFNEVERWHLEAAIKFLPNLLLLSVLLFFVGIGLLLVPVNWAVAGTVIAFAGSGMIISGISIAAGAILPMCPYQSAAARALRRIAVSSTSVGLVVWDRIVPSSRTGSSAFRTILNRLSQRSVRIRTWIVDRWESIFTTIQRAIRLPRPTSILPSDVTNVQGVEGHWRFGLAISAVLGQVVHHRDTDLSFQPEADDLLTVQAARWMFETTSNPGDQLSIVHYMHALDTRVCILMIQDINCWKRLLKFTAGAFEAWWSRRDKDSFEAVEISGKVVCRNLLWLYEANGKQLRVHLPGNSKIQDLLSYAELQETQFEFLEASKIIIERYSPRDPAAVFYLALLTTAFRRESHFRYTQYKWVEATSFIERSSPVGETLLSLWARSVASPFSRGKKSNESLVTVIEEARAKLASNLRNALMHCSKAMATLRGDVKSQEIAAKGFLFSLEGGLNSKHLDRRGHEGVVFKLEDLIQSYFNGLLASSTHGINNLATFAVKTILALALLRPPSYHKLPLVDLESLSDEPTAERVFNAASTLLMWYSSPHSVDKWRLYGDPRRGFTWCVIRVFVMVFDPKTARIWWFHKPSDMRGFLRSCNLLWRLMETEVDVAMTRKEDFLNEGMSLAEDDIASIGSCIENFFRIWTFPDFIYIAMNADVGINRLVAAVGRRIPWKYHHYDPREPRSLCSRSFYTAEGML